MIGKCAEVLRPETYADFAPNGLQVPGGEATDLVVSGVSASAELFARAAELGAGVIIVHHGLFWKGPPRPLDRGSKRRLELLFAHDMALLAYHLPLDGHQEIGNAALLARALGATGWLPWAGRPPLGVLAALPDVPAEELRDRVRALTGREPLVFLDGPPRVRSLAIVTGAGAEFLEDAIAEGHDAFLTGEPSERVMTRAREAGVHFLAAGHYATETWGVRALGDLLERELGVRHAFVDVPNPI